MVKISEGSREFITKFFPNLEDQMKMAQMGVNIQSFLFKSIVFSVIFGLNFSLLIAFLLNKIGFMRVFSISLLFFSLAAFFFSINIPKFNIVRVRKEIESDIFIPSRMLLTLLEAGNSLVSALEGVSYTKANSSKYFGKIATEIYLGKNIDEAIEDAIKYTPSRSFRAVLEPIKKSLRTGTDIQRNLLATLQGLQQEKVVEIEEYEKKLGPLAMFYMIFGTIIPALGVVGVVLFLSVLGIRVEFFPFFFILLMFVTMIQVIFLQLFKKTRPFVK